MKKKNLLLLALALAATATAWLLYQYTFNSSHRDISSETASAEVSAQSLQEAFLADETAASANYLDQVVAVSGTITDIEDQSLTLDDLVLVGMENTNNESMATGTSVTIKGRCIGFDELLEMVKIDQATLITNAN